VTLHHLFYPRGVAVVGSTAEGKLGAQLIGQLVAGGYHPIFAVNPKAQGLDGVPGLASVAQIEAPVDLAVIVSPPPTVAGVLDECGRAGVRAAVIITAGFSEVGDQAAEREIAAVARRHAIRFLGPNCAGIVNTHHHLAPTLETIPPRGGISFISQSGAVGGVLLAWAKEQNLGIGKFISYGNGADLREIELLRYLTADPDTDVVALYLETVSDGRAFMQAAVDCVAVKPLIVIKSGRTESGQRATLSHTGSMAGQDAVYDAALRQCGAVRLHTVEELFDLCKGLTMLPPPAGERVLIVTNSGGPGVMAADRAEEIGLDVAEPSPAARQALAQFLPPHCAFKNPIDLTVEATEETYRRTLLTLLDDYDAALALNIAPAYLDSRPLAAGVCQAAEASDKPIAAAFLPAPIVRAAVPILEARGVPNFATGERAVMALRQMVRVARNRGRARPRPVPDSPRDPLPGGETMLEHEAMAWLAENGIPVAPGRFAATPPQAVRAAHELGYPVAVKVVSPQILHKTEWGGVRLHLKADEEVVSAFAQVESRAAGHDFRGVVVYPMIDAVEEVLLGLSVDPQFGPVVAFGLGGIFTEVWRDITLRVAPLDRPEAEVMIRELRSLPLLTGARGRPACDLDALAETLVTFSQLPFRYPTIQEVDLNPVFLLSDGVCVGDVRVIKRSEPS
jgi:acetate---CoA ligase (ADP-forming)